jgi:hypothetical protein
VIRRRKPRLADLLPQCRPADRPDSIDFGPPAGREIIRWPTLGKFRRAAIFFVLRLTSGLGVTHRGDTGAFAVRPSVQQCLWLSLCRAGKSPAQGEVGRSKFRSRAAAALVALPGPIKKSIDYRAR